MNSRSFFLLIFFLQIFSYISPKKIIIPFKTKQYPFDPNDEYKFIFKNEIYTTLEVGDPPQKVELFFTMRTPFFMIKYNTSFPEYFKNESSSTYKYIGNGYYHTDEVLKQGILSTEKFIFQKSFDEKDKVEINNFDFIFGTKYKRDSKRHMGVFGLQFKTTSNYYAKETNFVNALKQNRMISFYVFNINYTSADSGYVVIGEKPDYYNDNYNEDDLRQINVQTQLNQNLVWNLYFNNIQYGDKALNDHRTCKFAPQFGVILGPATFDRYITAEFFQKYLDNKKCEKKEYDNKYYYFVCDENIDISEFKDIEFTMKDLSTKNFVLTKDDLFLKKNGKIYFLVAFGQSTKWLYCWHLGKPFMIKYNFVFDQDAKQILYYDKQDTGAINSMLGSKTFIILLWGGIFILIIIIGFLSYILYRLIKERKKRLYELDDDFDYVSGNDKEEKKNDAVNFEGDKNENKFGI